jgi:hypothetical protein
LSGTIPTEPAAIPAVEAPIRVPVSPENATEIWSQTAAKIPGLVGEHAKHFHRAAILAPNRLVVSFQGEYTFSRSICEAPDQRARFEQALAQVTGQRLRLEFETIDGEAGQAAPSAARTKSVHQRRVEVAEHPMVRRAMELFGAFPERVDEPGAHG